MPPLALARARPSVAPLRPACARGARRSLAQRPRACAAPPQPPAEPPRGAKGARAGPLFAGGSAFSDDFDGAITDAYISAAAAREEAYRRRWAELSGAAPGTLRPAASPPPAPAAVQPPAAGPTSAPSAFRTAAQETQHPPPRAPGGAAGGDAAAGAAQPAAPPARPARGNLPARASVSALWAVLFLLPVTTLLASLAAAAATQPAAAVRTLLVWLTGAAGLALSFSLLALAAAGGALLLRLAWQLLRGALPGDAGAAARAQMLRSAAPAAPADADGPRRFMRTRRPSDGGGAAASAPPRAPVLTPADDDAARLERLGAAALAAARWALPSFAALAALAAAATQPAAVERAAVSLFTAAFALAAAAVGTAAAVSAAALAVAAAVRRARAAWAEEVQPRAALRLPPLWQPDLTPPLPERPLAMSSPQPAGEVMLPPPWTPPPPQAAPMPAPMPAPPAAAAEAPPPVPPALDEFDRAALAARAAAASARAAALREVVPREGGGPGDGAADGEAAAAGPLRDGESLQALRQRAKAAYFNTKAWRNTGRGGSGSAGRTAGGADAAADPGFEARRAARADWQRRVQRAQGGPAAPQPTPPRPEAQP